MAWDRDSAGREDRVPDGNAELAGPRLEVFLRGTCSLRARGVETQAMAFSNVTRALASAVLFLSLFAFTSCSGEKEGSGVVTSDRTTPRESTSSDSASEPPLDPEGEKIAFLSDRDGGNFEIYLMNIDGTEVTRLTETAGREGEPVWSSDGRRIAFERLSNGNADVYIMNSDGSGEMRLTDNAAYDGDPAWSPDGTKIAFETNRDGDFELFVMNADGTGVTRLTRNRTGDTSPAWSPDGARILFARGDGGDQFEIYVMNADGSEQTRVTKFRGPDIFPAWAPDGGSFAFMGGYEIDVATADGITRLTKNKVWDAVPSWSANGSKIAFERERDGNFDIYVMNADGSEQTRITDEPAIDRFPAWSPAGSR